MILPQSEGTLGETMAINCWEPSHVFEIVAFDL